MKTRPYVFALAALAAPLLGAECTVPIPRLSCEVSRAGLLEAEIDNTAGPALTCMLRCEYVIGDATLSHRFEVAIPARFRGIVGQFDTARGLPGNYAGRVGACMSRDQSRTTKR